MAKNKTTLEKRGKVEIDRNILLSIINLAAKEIRVNRQIRCPQVFLINEKGEKCGNISTFDALNMADEAGLDLVEISPNSNPPVCKILDYGKYRYELERKQREAKKNQTIVKVKEVRMQVKVDVGDMKTKVRFITEFLSEGNKVRVSVRFRGREMQHLDIGQGVLEKVLGMLSAGDVAYQIEQPATMEGRMMSMLLAPTKAKQSKQSSSGSQSPQSSAGGNGYDSNGDQSTQSA